MRKTLKTETDRILEAHPDILPDTKLDVKNADRLYGEHLRKTNGSELHEALKETNPHESIQELLYHKDPSISSKAIEDFSKFIDKDHNAFNDLKAGYLLNKGTKIENGKFSLDPNLLANHIVDSKGSSASKLLFSEEEQRQLDNLASDFSKTLGKQLPYQKDGIVSQVASILPYGYKLGHVSNPYTNMTSNQKLLELIADLGKDKSSVVSQAGELLKSRYKKGIELGGASVGNIYNNK